MKRKWWKAYFVVVVMLTALGGVLPLFVEPASEMLWAEWLYLPFYAIQLVGLYCFIYDRRLGRQAGWQVLFVVGLAYEAWAIMELLTMSELRAIDQGMFAASSAAIALAIQGPLLFGLFKYGFRSPSIWHGAT